MLQKTRMNRQIGNHKSSLSTSGRWNIYLLRVLKIKYDVYTFFLWCNILMHSNAYLYSEFNEST